MSILDSIGSIVSAAAQPQIQAAEDEAAAVAQYVAVWAVVVVVELGIVIYFLSRRSNRAG